MAPVLIAGDGTRVWFEVVWAAAGDGRAGDPGPGGRSPARPVVVLCPPGGRNAAYWPDAFVAELVAAGVDVVRLDWRGQGRSDWSPASPPAAVLVDDVDAVCRAVVGDDPATGLFVVGVGLGGWVAAQLARRRSDRGWPLARLVLVGTSGWYSDPAMAGPTEPTVVSLVLRRRGGGPAELARALAREVAVEEARPGPVDGAGRLADVQRWLAHGFNPEDGHRVTWLAAPPLWDELDAVADRVVVVHGERDPVVPLAHGERLAHRAGGELVVVPGAGHHVEETVRAVLLGVLDPDADTDTSPVADGASADGG